MWPNRVAALVTHELSHRVTAAVGMFDEPGRAGLTGEVTVAPLQQCDHGGSELAALARQAVLVASRPLLVADALEDSLVDQVAESLGEHVAGDAETRLKLLEALQPEEGVTDDQQAPPLPDDLERSRDRADLLSYVRPSVPLA